MGIIEFDLLKYKQNATRICKCENPTYIIDRKNRLVYCEKCEVIKDPFAILEEFADRGKKLNEKTERIREYQKELMSYKPHLKSIKSLESNIRSGKMLPYCPQCNQLFKIEEIYQYGNKAFYKEVVKGE